MPVTLYSFSHIACVMPVIPFVLDVYNLLVISGYFPATSACHFVKICNLQLNFRHQ